MAGLLGQPGLRMPTHNPAEEATMYDSRSTHPHGGVHTLRAWRKEDWSRLPVRPQIAAALDVAERMTEDLPEPPDYLGLKRLGGLATWEVMLLQWAAETGTSMEALRDLGVTDEDCGLAEVEHLRESWSPWELECKGLPEDVAWSSVFVDESLAEYLTRTDDEWPEPEYAEDADLDYAPWIAYMPLTEFREHMEHYDGWHVTTRP